MQEHQWKKTSNLIYCKICKVIKGSDPDKASMCHGKREPVREPVRQMETQR